eukprot:s1369_g4.t1
MYTLYEITFAGKLGQERFRAIQLTLAYKPVSHAYVIFFVLYITVIAFAVIRVISAVFLKDTLDAAQNDAEHMVVDRLRKKAEYVEKLEIIFRAIDDSGDGLGRRQCRRWLQVLRIAAYFQTLDLDVHEGAALFHLLDNGDGEVTLEEFIDGIMRCKGPARAIDQDLKQLDAKMAKLLYAMGGGSSKKREKDMLLLQTSVFSKDKKNHLKAFRHDVSSAVFHVSLGPAVLLSSHCIVIVHHLLDRFVHCCPSKHFDVAPQVSKSRKQRQSRLERRR